MEIYILSSNLRIKCDNGGERVHYDSVGIRNQWVPYPGIIQEFGDKPTFSQCCFKAGSA